MHFREVSIYHTSLLAFTRRSFTPGLHIMSLKRKQTSALAKDDSKKPKKNGDLTAFFGAPKATPTKAQADPVVSFDKDKWVATLTPEQKQLLKLEIDTMDPSWLRVLKEEILSAISWISNASSRRRSPHRQYTLLWKMFTAGTTS